MRVLELEPGLLLYPSQVVDQCDLRTSNLLHPSLKLLVLLDGATQVRYGPHWHVLDARSGPCALLVNLARSDCFMRQWQRGRAERKLLLSCTPQWLQGKGLAQHALAHADAHAQALRWQPSRKACALAEQLHHDALTVPQADALQLLLWLGKAQVLLAEALASVAVGQGGRAPAPVDQQGVSQDLPRAGAPHAVSPARPARVSELAWRRLVAVREWMATAHSDGMDVPAVARHAGMSVSYLQRMFPHVAGGQSVAAFLRSQRLQRARWALERGGASVAQAAEIAGFHSSTHFAKAFRQAYGCAPSQWQAGA